MKPHEKFKSAREAIADLSQGKLAELAGVNQSDISKIEKGNKQIPIGKIDLFASLLNISRDDLIPKQSSSGGYTAVNVTPSSHTQKFSIDTDLMTLLGAIENMLSLGSRGYLLAESPAKLLAELISERAAAQTSAPTSTSTS